MGSRILFQEGESPLDRGPCFMDKVHSLPMFRYPTCLPTPQAAAQARWVRVHDRVSVHVPVEADDRPREQSGPHAGPHRGLRSQRRGASAH